MLKSLFLILVAAGAAGAQQVAAPTPEQMGSPRGDTVGNYNVTQSFETGYRWNSVNGDQGMYRSVVNFGNGIRLLGSSLSVNSKDGHGHYFDEILLNTQGLGNDPYQSAMLRVQKNGLYRYDMLWRLNDYYNPGLAISGGLHSANTSRRLQDHDLTLFPQSHFRLRMGYSRDTEDGPALSTAQEFDTNGSPYPVFVDVVRHWNEYRLGGDVDLGGFKFTVLRRWDFFKDDSPFTVAGVAAAGTPTDQTVLQQFQRSEPIHGSNPGWLGNLFARKKLWGVNARLTYVSGNRDFALVESAAGLGQFGAAASRQIAVGGNASRPALAGDLNLSFFPTEKLTVVNNTSVASNRIDGDSSYSEVNTGLNRGTSISFRYLGIRMVTNSTDLNYRATNWVGFYAGYHYSDRLVRTTEGLMLPPLDTSFNNTTYEVSNHLNSGTLGVRFHPLKPLTINLDGELGRANNPLTPISDRRYHSLNGRVDYRTRKLQLSAAYRQVYNLNAPFVFSGVSSHSRTYSANASWTPRDWFSLDAGYARLHLDSLTGLVFFAGTGSRSQLQTGYASLYVSNIHSANLTARVGIGKRADLFVGYNLTKDTGDGRSSVTTGISDPIQALLDSVQTFPLTYQSPLARVSIRITTKLRWNAGWQYYGYNEKFRILGAYQNFYAHTGYTSLLWTF